MRSKLRLGVLANRALIELFKLKFKIVINEPDPFEFRVQTHRNESIRIPYRIKPEYVSVRFDMVFEFIEPYIILI